MIPVFSVAAPKINRCNFEMVVLAFFDQFHHPLQRPQKTRHLFIDRGRQQLGQARQQDLELLSAESPAHERFVLSGWQTFSHHKAICGKIGPAGKPKVPSANDWPAWSDRSCPARWSGPPGSNWPPGNRFPGTVPDQ